MLEWKNILWMATALAAVTSVAHATRDVNVSCTVCAKVTWGHNPLLATPTRREKGVAYIRKREPCTHVHTHTVTRCYPTAGTELQLQSWVPEETHPLTESHILTQIQTIWTLPDFESYYYFPPCHVDAGVESHWEKTGLRVSGECPSDPSALSAFALGLEFLPEARPSLRVWNPSLYRLTCEECVRWGVVSDGSLTPRLFSRQPRHGGLPLRRSLGWSS